MTKKVLVTGAGGFIGSHVTEALLARGWQVRALVRYNSRSHRGWLEQVATEGTPGLDIVAGDVTDPAQVRTLASGCDAICHLAALIGIPYSYAAPRTYVETNVMGTVNLAQAALDLGISRFVHTSTSEVYGTARVTPIDERHPLQAQSPYAATKIAADKMVESFVAAFDLPAIVVRPFNTYGPRQSARAVIPTIISQALDGPEVKLGALDPERDLTFVTDTAAGFVAALEADDAACGGVYNLGTGSKVSIGRLAEMIFEQLGGAHRITTDAARTRPANSEVMELISDNSLAATALGWRPEISLEAGLASTIRWIRDHRDVFRSSEYAV